MTRKRALDILIAAAQGPHNIISHTDAIDALDRAGAFPSEATEAEIGYVAREILAKEIRSSRRGELPDDFGLLAVRLARACRAAGLVR